MFSTSFPSPSAPPTLSHSRSVDSALPIVRIRTVTSDVQSFDWADDVERYHEHEASGRGRSDAKKPLRFLFPTAREPNPHPCLQAIFRRSSAPACVPVESYATLNANASTSPSSSLYSSPSSSSSSSTVAPSMEGDTWEEAPEKEEIEWVEYGTISMANLESGSDTVKFNDVSVGPYDDERGSPVRKTQLTVPWVETEAGTKVGKDKTAGERDWKTLWQR